MPPSAPVAGHDGRSSLERVMRKTIGLVAACIGLAAFAGSSGKGTAADPKAAPAKEAKPSAAPAVADGGTVVDAGTPAKAPAKK